ncbi:MAG: hypothetical protein ACLR7Z_09305 [Bilophila wadsworthia]
MYSGMLGEVTGIQAGRDINKAAYEYKQYQVKLKELTTSWPKNRPSSHPCPCRPSRRESPRGTLLKVNRLDSSCFP